VLSENVPVATNCLVIPIAVLGLDGVIATEMSVAAVTVSVVDPDRVPVVAVIVVEPAATEVTSPAEPAVLLILAIDDADELQTTSAVRSWVVLSENVPVAANCRVIPIAMLGLVGVTVMDASVADVIVNVVEPETVPFVAVIVVLQAPLPLKRPFVIHKALTESDDDQVAVVVRSCVVLSE